MRHAVRPRLLQQHQCRVAFVAPRKRVHSDIDQPLRVHQVRCCGRCTATSTTSSAAPTAATTVAAVTSTQPFDAVEPEPFVSEPLPLEAQRCDLSSFGVEAGEVVLPIQAGTEVRALAHANKGPNLSIENNNNTHTTLKMRKIYRALGEKEI